MKKLSIYSVKVIFYKVIDTIVKWFGKDTWYNGDNFDAFTDEVMVLLKDESSKAVAEARSIKASPEDAVQRLEKIFNYYANTLKLCSDDCVRIWDMFRDMVADGQVVLNDPDSVDVGLSYLYVMHFRGVSDLHNRGLRATLDDIKSFAALYQKRFGVKR